MADLYDATDLPGGLAPAPPPPTDFTAYGGLAEQNERDAKLFASMADAFTAARKAQEYDGNATGRVAATQDAAQARVDAIQKATGTQLENPYNGGYVGAALERLHADPSRWANPDGTVDTSVQGTRNRITQVATDIFQENLNGLREQFPQHADVIGADRPIALDAKQMASGWADRAAAGEPGLDAVTGTVMGFLGGGAGFFRDPVNTATLFLGGGEVRAASWFGKIVEGGLRQAALNAGAQALAEPDVQAWRAERGKDTGLMPALHDIGMAAVFGAIPGMGIEAAKVFARRSPDLHAPLSAHEADRAVTANPPAAAHLDDAYAGALAHAEDPAAPLPEMPATIAEGPGRVLPLGGEPTPAKGLVPANLMGDGTVYVGKPGDLHFSVAERHPASATGALQEAGFVNPQGRFLTREEALEWVNSHEAPVRPSDNMPGQLDATDYRSQVSPQNQSAGDISLIRDPIAAADLARTDPAAVATAVASDAPDIRLTGRLASLGDEAFADLQSGRIDMRTAEAVAARVIDPTMQAEIAREVAAGAPKTPLDAAIAVTDAMEARGIREAQRAILRVPDPIEELTSPLGRFDTIAAFGKQSDEILADFARWTPPVFKPEAPAAHGTSLLPFLARKGLRDDPELRALLDTENPFVPGRGTLIRKSGGLSLDDALRAAEEAGYFREASGEPRALTPADLLEALSREHRQGEKLYPFDAAAAGEQWSKAAEKNEASALKMLREHIKPREDGEPIPDAVFRDAARRMVGGEKDPYRAFDAAALEHERGGGDLLDMTPLPHESGEGFTPMRPDLLAAERPREEVLSLLVKDCSL